VPFVSQREPAGVSQHVRMGFKGQLSLNSYPLNHAGETGFAQTLKRGLQHRFALDQPFNGEFRIEAASFGQGGFRLIYITLQRVSRSQIEVRVKSR
jgi:hypothetical protein